MSGIDLDRLAAGCTSVSWHPWRAVPGVVVGVRALTGDAWADAKRTAEDRVPDSISGPARVLAVAHEHSIEMVTRCVVMPDDSGELAPMLGAEDARLLDDDALAELMSLIRAEQNAAHGESLDFDEVTKAIKDDPRSTLEKSRAIHATSLRSYYGAPARTLTDWQVLIFLHLIRKDD